MQMDDFPAVQKFLVEKYGREKMAGNETNVRVYLLIKEQVVNWLLNVQARVVDNKPCGIVDFEVQHGAVGIDPSVHVKHWTTVYTQVKCENGTRQELHTCENSPSLVKGQFRKVQNVGGGNCLYLSLAQLAEEYSLDAQFWDAGHLKALCVNWLRGVGVKKHHRAKHSSLLKNIVDAEKLSVEEFIKKHATDGTWADDFMVNIASFIMNVTICTYTEVDGGNLSMVGGAAGEDDLTEPPPLLFLTLSNIADGGNHYEAIIPTIDQPVQSAGTNFELLGAPLPNYKKRKMKEVSYQNGSDGSKSHKGSGGTRSHGTKLLERSQGKRKLDEMNQQKFEKENLTHEEHGAAIPVKGAKSAAKVKADGKGGKEAPESKQVPRPGRQETPDVRRHGTNLQSSPRRAIPKRSKSVRGFTLPSCMRGGEGQPVGQILR